MNIRFSGFGGQGIVLSAVIYGHAAVLEGKNAIQTQSYGSESRGGACKSDVTISDEEICELESPQVDVLVALSQEAYENYLPTLRDGGILIIDKDLVQIAIDSEGRGPTEDKGITLNRMVEGIATEIRTSQREVSIYAISATDLAFKKFGRGIMANMVVLGFMATVLRNVSPEGLKRAIKQNVPAGTEGSNIEAFEEGYMQGGGRA